MVDGGGLHTSFTHLLRGVTSFHVLFRIQKSIILLSVLKLSHGILPSLPAELIFALLQSVSASTRTGHQGQTYIRVIRHNAQRRRNSQHVKNREESVTPVPPEVPGSIGVEFYIWSASHRPRSAVQGRQPTVVFLQGRVKDQR